MPWNDENKSKRPPAKVGFINRVLVNKILFAIVANSILISVLMIIFVIWDYIGEQVAYKTVATGATLIGGGILFSFVNDYFGSKTNLFDDHITRTEKKNEA